jgi:hypothetical protein
MEKPDIDVREKEVQEKEVQGKLKLPHDYNLTNSRGSKQKNSVNHNIYLLTTQIQLRSTLGSERGGSLRLDDSLLADSLNPTRQGLTVQGEGNGLSFLKTVTNLN